MFTERVFVNGKNKRRLKDNPQGQQQYVDQTCLLPSPVLAGHLQSSLRLAG